MSYRYANVQLTFPLTEARVTLLANAGVNSIKDLRRVLAALDLGCKVELCALQSLPGEEKEEEVSGA